MSEIANKRWNGGNSEFVENGSDELFEDFLRPADNRSFDTDAEDDIEISIDSDECESVFCTENESSINLFSSEESATKARILKKLEVSKAESEFLSDHSNEYILL